MQQHLRYSPVNWQIINWSFNGRAFDDCCLPRPLPCPDKPEQPAPCDALPIREAIDTYDWFRWLPEVLVGIDDPDEEIAANYVREAAIDFAKDSRVLQRQIIVELQGGVCTYPLYPYEGENIIGVIAAKLDEGPACGCADSCGGFVHTGLGYRLDVARNEITFEDRSACASCHGRVRLLVWSAPSEDACEHDKFLYDYYRREITLLARRNYANAVHFRDRLLMNSLPTAEAYNRAKVQAKVRAMGKHLSGLMLPGRGMYPASTGGGW